jgi:surface carbohydrate biosynthesis protein
MDIVKKEWQNRIANNLPPYHSVNDKDIGFRFQKPIVKDIGTQAFLDGDYETMERSWQTSSALPIQQITTLKQLPLKIGYTLPKVEHLIKPPEAEFITYLFCDGLYFKKFGAKLAISIQENLHIHLMDADPTFAQKIIKDHNLQAGLSIEQPKANPEYYHSIRFIRWYEYMKQTRAFSCLLDVDALANKHPSHLPKVEIGMRLRPARLEPWNVCNASVCVGKANQYWKGVADYIYHFYNNNKLVWQIDQLALWAVWQKQRTHIHTLTEKEVSYDYHNKGIIWCNSGKNKWQKEDITRQKYRDKFNSITIDVNKKSLNELEKYAKQELKSLNTKEAHRLYLRLLRKCFEQLPQKSYKTETINKPVRKVEKILYLPVEISARELASREWLAKQMKGWKVVIGNRWQMQNWNDLPPGVVLWKSANTQDVGVFVDAINSGHLICLMDEELFPMLPNMELYKPSIDTKCLDYADMIFAHSDKQKQLFEELTQTPVEVTGNPRSLLAKNIKTGNKTIICTMAGTVNNYGRSFYDMIAGTVRLLGGASDEIFDFLAYQITHEINGYELTRKAIDELEDPLIRCHPSEDISFWQDLGTVDDRTPFMQRLADAKCIVHVSGCGTGLEATLAGIPTVRLGEGGHGLSAEIGQGVSVKISNAVKKSVPQTAPKFADVTLPNTIIKLQKKHSFACEFDLEKAYKNIPFEPNKFYQNKFPTDPKGKLIGWRTVLWQ